MNAFQASLCLAAGCLGIALAADNTPPPGFTALFNGRDLAGWQVPEGDGGNAANRVRAACKSGTTGDSCSVARILRTGSVATAHSHFPWFTTHHG